MCSLLLFVYAEFQLSAIIETLPQMIKKNQISFWFLSRVGPKSPDIYELYLGSVRVKVGFRIGASFIKRMFSSISCWSLIATRFLFRLQLSPTTGGSTNCAANLKQVPASCSS